MRDTNRRKVLTSMGAGIGATLLAGCLGDGDDGGDGGSGDGGSGDGGSGDGGTGGDSLEDRAREEGQMTFYSVIDEEGMRNTILPPFQEEYDWMEFNLVSMGVSEIASSMSTEYQTDNVESDSAMNTKGTMSPLTNAGVFREPDSDGELMQFIQENYPEEAYSLPAVPGYLFPIQVMVHTERIDEDAYPETLEDFANPELEGRIAFDDPTILNTAGGIFASYREIIGTDEWQSLMEDIANNGPTLTSSSSESSRMLAQGEVDVAIGSLNDTLALQEDDEPIEGLWVEPTVALDLPIYFSAGSENPNAAELFAKWILGEEGQRAIAETGRVPADSDIAAEEFEDIIPSDVEVRPVAYNDQSYYEDPEMWIERYEEYFG